MHSAQSLAFVLTALAATPAAATDCRMGTNMPAGDANPAKAIAEGHPSRVPFKLSDPHPAWSVNNKNEDYPKTIEEWDPHKDPAGQHLSRAIARIRVAIDHDDSRAPEMAMVSRWDLMTLIHDYWQKSAVFEMWVEERRLSSERTTGSLRPGSGHVAGSVRESGIGRDSGTTAPILVNVIDGSVID
jgi:hypothetical protein